MLNQAKRIISTILVAAMLVSSVVVGLPVAVSAAGSFSSVGGWFESIYAEISGVKASDVTSVSYSGAMSGSLDSEGLKYLVRDVNGKVRIDVPGVKAGTYTLTVKTTSGDITESGIEVLAHDRSGYAHYNYTEGVGAYNDDGTLKANAIVLYVTDANKNSVTVKSKDGTTVTGIGNILNTAGMESSNGLTSNGGKTNANQGILLKLAQDGTPLVVRIIGNVTAPAGLTAYSSVDYGGTVGDNGFMARMKDAKDVTIEGIGPDAIVNGWGFHFMCTADHPEFGKSFEARNVTFRNVPEDCLGMEGVQSGSTLTASVERCWIHNCSFYGPTISNPAESDKAGGDGACDFKRGQYMTMDYCYYEGYHKTNLVGANSSNLQYNITWHHNYWKDCQSRGPLGRQANMHIYNCIYEGNTSQTMDVRADCYIFSEYNSFINCVRPQDCEGEGGGVIKSYHDSFTSCQKEQQGIVVTDKNQKVSSNNKYANFDTNSSLSYIPSGDYQLQESLTDAKAYILAYAGPMKANPVDPGDVNTSLIPGDRYPSKAVTLPYDKDMNTTSVPSKAGTYDNILFNVGKTASDSITVGGQVTGCDIVFYVDVPVNISMTAIAGTYLPDLCNAAGENLLHGTGTVTNVPAGYYFIQSTYDPGNAKYKEAKLSHLKIEAYDPNATPVDPSVPPTTPTQPSQPTEPGATDPTGPVTPPTEGSYIHNFTTDKLNNGFYTISGTWSDSKGTVTYNGLTLTGCLKMETSTSVTFNAPSEGTLTLVFNGNGNTKLDGTSYTPSNNILTLDVAAGSHTISKDNVNNLYYIVYTPKETDHTHSYTSKVTTPADCIHDGVMTFACSCGDSYTERIPATGEHTYSDSFTVDKEPTETEAGQKSRHCTTAGCDAKTDITVIEPHTHVYDNGVVTKAPDCIHNGVKTFTCQCGATKTEPIPATGVHTYSDTYTVDRQPTATVEGEESRHCTTSGCTAKTGARPIPVIDVGQDSQGILESAGHLESAYVEWTPVKGATGYNVYVKPASAADNAYVQLDTMLIRGYNGYVRADALGLKAGKYVMKIVPLNGSTLLTSQTMITKELTVLAHDRSGYAFVNGTSNGAYNDDGTLKANAVVLYITEENKDTVSMDVTGATANPCVGLQNILNGFKKGKDNRPLCVRIIGNITDFAVMDKGDLLVDTNKQGLTIEGVGEDATANGWGLRIKNSSNVEVRNLGFMNCDSDEGDNIGLQQGNDHVWVHNCDLFYGHSGSDADQVKGDGALDTKKSQYVTHSYNHFWDSGKCNLQGNGGDTSRFITYHHNWFDHSDSRHPRVREADTIHVYNNFYDGNSKYGIGATCGCSIFAESNYFLNCKYPMLISMQGNDVYNGNKPTFSSEDGGMIKAFGNIIIGETGFFSQIDRPDDFDAVVVTDRDEKVNRSPINGGRPYSNFDTASGFHYINVSSWEELFQAMNRSNAGDYYYRVQSAESVAQTVENYAGRVNGGDFQWTFTDADNTDYDVNQPLKDALGKYDDKILSIGGNSVETEGPDEPDPTEPTTNPGETTKPSQPTDPTTPSQPTTPPVAGPDEYIHNFEDGLVDKDGFYTFSGKIGTDKGNAYYNGMTLTGCMKMESATIINFTAPCDGKLVMVFGLEVDKESAAGKNVKLDGTKYQVGADGTVTIDVAAGVHTVTKGDVMNLFYIEFIPNEAEKPAESVDATCKVLYQIRLIEPWGLRINVRFTDGTDAANTLDYSKFTDWGAYAVRRSQLDDPTADIATLTYEDIRDNASAFAYSKADDTMTWSGNYLSFIFDDGLFTYRLSEDIVWAAYYVDENGTHFTPVNERNLSELMNERKDSPSSTYSAYEKAVYAAMCELEDSITDYRSDFPNVSDMPQQNTGTMASTNIGFGTAAADDAFLFARIQQIGLIEPWGMRLNTRIYEQAQAGISNAHTDYSALDDYGLIVFHDKDGVIANAADMDSYDELLNYSDKENVYVFSQSQGTMEESGVYAASIYNKDIYTYQLDSTMYYVFFAKSGDNFYYSQLYAQNIRTLAADRAESSSTAYTAKEKAVYADMVALCDAITAYREDYFSHS